MKDRSRERGVCFLHIYTYNMLYNYTCLSKQQQRVVLGGGKHNPTSFASPESGKVVVTGDLREEADGLRRVNHEVETLHVPWAVFFWACVIWDRG